MIDQLMGVFMFLCGAIVILFRKTISRGTASFNSKIFGINEDESYYELGFVAFAIILIVVGLLRVVGIIEAG